MSDATALWNDLAARASLTLSADQHARLSQYLDLLLEANQKINLTRITDRAAAEVQHVGDALTLLPFLPATPHRLADVGSGGGVPGIPLAIARPDATVFLIESTQKKAAFLRHAAESLHLSNITVLPARAEDAANDPALRESFDVAIARAVATTVWLAEWCLPLVRKGGKVLFMKGPRHAEELPAAISTLPALGGGPPTIHAIDLPGATGLVVVEIPKVARSDKRLPRPATAAKGKPLG